MLIVIALFLLSFFCGTQFVKNVEKRTLRSIRSDAWVIIFMISLFLIVWPLMIVAVLFVKYCVSPMTNSSWFGRGWVVFTLLMRSLSKERQWFWNTVPDKGHKGLDNSL